MCKICTNHDFSKQRLIVHDVGLHPSLLLCPPCRRCLPLHKVTVPMIFGCCHCSLIYNVAIMRIIGCCHCSLLHLWWLLVVFMVGVIWRCCWSWSTQYGWIMRIVSCCQGCCLHKGTCYDDQWLLSLVVAFWWFMVMVQLVVIWDCIHIVSSKCSYYEDRWLLSFFLETVEVMVVSPKTISKCFLYWYLDICSL